MLKKLPRAGFELAPLGRRSAALPIELSSQQGLEPSFYPFQVHEIFSRQLKRLSPLRLSGDNVLVIPKVNTTKNGLKSWSYFASKLRNDLDNDTRLQVGTKDFIRTIRSKTFEST